MLTYLQAFVSIIVGRLNIKSERGATAVEYGIMVALIAVVIIAAVTLIGTNLKAIFEFVSTKLTVPAAGTGTGTGG